MVAVPGQARKSGLEQLSPGIRKSQWHRDDRENKFSESSQSPRNANDDSANFNFDKIPAEGEQEILESVMIREEENDSPLKGKGKKKPKGRSPLAGTLKSF